MKSKESTIERYIKLRELIDQMAADLETINAGGMVCRKGCCDCCVNLTVFPVEFFAIVEGMKKAGVSKPAFDAARACGYLDEQGACVIYPFRPMICRTQGLPLAFYDDQQEGYSVSFCPKNFAEDDPEDLDFGPDNTLNLDDLNDALFEIHLAYLAEHPESGYTEQTRIELSRLGEFL